MSLDVTDEGPSFSADSIVLPEDAHRERPGGSTLRPPAPSILDRLPVRGPLLFVTLGSIGLFVGGLLFALIARSPDPVPQAIETALAVQAAPQPAAEAPPAATAPDPAPSPPPVAADPDHADRADRKRDDRRSTGARMSRSAQKGPGGEKLDERVDEALAKLDTIGEADAKEPPVAPPPAEDAAGNDESACASGSSDACVRAGERAAKSSDADGGERARTYFGMACAKNDAGGCWRLARLLDRGIGGPKEPSRAKTLRRTACDLGHRESCDSESSTPTTTSGD